MSFNIEARLKLQRSPRVLIAQRIMDTDTGTSTNFDDVMPSNDISYDLMTEAMIQLNLLALSPLTLLELALHQAVKLQLKVLVFE